MSFDLAAWYSEQVLDAAAATAIYHALCEGRGFHPPGAEAGVPQFGRFKAAVEDRFPHLDSLPDEAVDASPWSGGPDWSDRAAVFTIRWSRSREMLDLLSRLAAEHDLVLYDPQAEAVHHPPRLSAAPWWQFWRR